MPLMVFDIECDEDCALMDSGDFGIYVRLLMRQWIEGSIPPETEALAKLIRENQKVFDCFTKRFLDKKLPIGKDGRRRNEKLAELREKAIQKVIKLRANARKGGRPKKLGANQKVPTGKPNAKPDGEAGAYEYVYESEFDSGSREGESLREGDPIQWAGDDRLEKIRQAYPETKRGGVARGRQTINTAIDSIMARHASTIEDAAGWLLGRVQAYAASDQGKSEYAPNLVRWMEDGCYDQSGAEWAKVDYEKAARDQKAQERRERWKQEEAKHVE